MYMTMEKEQGMYNRDRLIGLETALNFGEALMLLKSGEAVYREGWNGKGMWLKLQEPDENSKMSRPCIYMKTADDKLVPWVASKADLLVDDWRWYFGSNDNGK